MVLANGFLNYLNVINSHHVNHYNSKLIKNVSKYHLYVLLMDKVVYLLHYVQKLIQLVVV